jgi:hypothetical protein
MICAALEITQHVLGILVALVQLAGEQALQDVVQPVVNLRVQLAEVGDREAENALAGFLRGAGLEHVPPQQQVPENDARREQVGALVGDLEIGLLGAHVVGLAGDDFSLLIGQQATRLGDAEVRQLHVAFKGDEDVLHADVAVDDAQRVPVRIRLGMGIGQATRNAAGDEHREVARQMPVLGGELLEELFEVHAADEFHGDEVLALRFPELVGLDDVRVDQVGDELGFADEVVQEQLLPREVLPDELERHAFDESLRTQLLGLVNDPHATFVELAHNAVVELVLDRERRHGVMVRIGCAKSSARQ